MLRCILLLLGATVLAGKAWAIEEFVIEIRDHLFYPSRVTLPAFKKVKLVIRNLDDTPEEFDSFDLNREKVIFAKRSAVIYVGPLQPGTYVFFGEYNPNTARGEVLVRDPAESSALESDSAH